MRGWFRYFGPPKVFLSDQEGALAGDAFAALCDALEVYRWLAGSDPERLKGGGKHTSTGLAEKHIDLIKLAMLGTFLSLLNLVLEIEVNLAESK